jgi:hypothetical protein
VPLNSKSTEIVPVFFHKQSRIKGFVAIWTWMRCQSSGEVRVTSLQKYETWERGRQGWEWV